MMLWQIAPDLFPEGYTTDVELILWGFFYDEQEKRRNEQKQSFKR